MIPKTIHYCWFGGAPLPKPALRCIQSWKKYCPDYEIIEWNESNFDINIIPYVKEAYAAKKYAFVSDYARFYILHRQGGVYMDTDVELIKPLDDIIKQGAFMGYEQPSTQGTPIYKINPGLGMGCPPGNPIIQAVKEHYDTLCGFDYSKQGTVCDIVSNILGSRGISIDGTLFKSDEITLYPVDFFCPKSFYDGKMRKTANTVSIHHYDMSWLSFLGQFKRKLQRFLSHIMPEKTAAFICEKTYRVINRLISIFQRKKK